MSTPPSDIIRQRLRNQGLVGPPLARPEEVVASLGAVQAQDYAGAKWGIGQRTARTTDVDLDRVFDSGAILRTHVMRPTWHFVSPADIRWLLKLTAPRVRAVLLTTIESSSSTRRAPGARRLTATQERAIYAARASSTARVMIRSVKGASAGFASLTSAAGARTRRL